MLLAAPPLQRAWQPVPDSVCTAGGNVPFFRVSCSNSLRADIPQALTILPCYGCRVAALQVSGKTWKGEAEKRASADKNAVLGSSWEKKMQAKALKKAFQEQKQAAVDAHKEKRKVRGAGIELGCALLTVVSNVPRRC